MRWEIRPSRIHLKIPRSARTQGISTLHTPIFWFAKTRSRYLQSWTKLLEHLTSLCCLWRRVLFTRPLFPFEMLCPTENSDLRNPRPPVQCWVPKKMVRPQLALVSPTLYGGPGVFHLVLSKIVVPTLNVCCETDTVYQKSKFLTRK